MNIKDYIMADIMALEDAKFSEIINAKEEKMNQKSGITELKKAKVVQESNDWKGCWNSKLTTGKRYLWDIMTDICIERFGKNWKMDFEYELWEMKDPQLMDAYEWAGGWFIGGSNADGVCEDPEWMSHFGGLKFVTKEEWEIIYRNKRPS